MIGSYLHRRGFTLIEVLVAVLVLALGLLGLAAVFPVVLREQRVATDTVQGLSAQRSVENFILSHADLNRSDYPLGASQPSGLGGWSRWINKPQWSAYGEWLPAPLMGSELDQFSGNWRLNFLIAPDGQQVPPTEIPIFERLLPAIGSGVDAQYVWDIVGRRVDAGVRNQVGVPSTFQDDAVQLAIFIRPVDRSIRTSGNQTVRGLITDGFVSAVAVDSAGRPTYRGLDEASAPNHAPISLLRVQGFYPIGSTPPRLDRVVFQSTGFSSTGGSNAVLSELASQVGQRLVDSFGDIHSVVGFYTEDGEGPPDAVVIEPPMRPEAFERLTDTNNPLQVLVSPQVPASVSILTIPR